MAVKSSGQLAMTEIVAEFGGSAPHAMSEYYGGAGLVPSGANPNVPTSGQSKFSNFYNSVAATVLNILSNTTNYNIKTAVQAVGGDLNTPVILTIGSGVTVSGTSASTPAMKTDTGWGSGNTINIINNGSIVGASGTNTSGNPPSGGGQGGAGGANGAGGAGGAGAAGSGSADSANNGGNAFEHSQTGDNNLAVVFDTAGTRTAGSAGTKTVTGNGGGGGGGGSNGSIFCCGGGGGGGANGGGGGAAGDATAGASQPGSSGGSTSGGAGGGQGGFYCATNRPNNNCGNAYHGGGGTGGTGGGLGNNGASGGGGGHFQNCNQSGGGRPGGSGGAAGANGSISGSAGSALSGNTGQIS